MTDSNSLPEANDTERQELLTHLKNLGLTTNNESARMSSESPEEFQNLVDRLLDTKKKLQDDFRQLITIKEAIEKYLSRLISDMLDGKDVIEPLRQGMEIYPSLRFISWLVEGVERDLTEFIKDLDLDRDYALQILYRWKYEYKPLGDIWWELTMREHGMENSWTGIIREPYYNELRQMPQASIKLLSKRRIVWNAREDIDDIAGLAVGLLNICLRTLSEPREHRYVHPVFIKNMNTVIRDTEKIINQLKALPILSSQNVSENLSEDSTNIQ
jgi:hypothetical protein